MEYTGEEINDTTARARPHVIDRDMGLVCDVAGWLVRGDVYTAALALAHESGVVSVGWAPRRRMLNNEAT